MNDCVYLYIFGTPERPPYKVGFSATPNRRKMTFAKEYEGTHTPDMSILVTISFQNKDTAAMAEKHVHCALNEWRNELHRGREWFDVAFDVVHSAVSDAMREFSGEIVRVSQRPSTLSLPFSDITLDKIDDLRRIDSSLPSRAQVIRRAIHEAYERNSSQIAQFYERALPLDDVEV